MSWSRSVGLSREQEQNVNRWVCHEALKDEGLFAEAEHGKWSVHSGGNLSKQKPAPASVGQDRLIRIFPNDQDGQGDLPNL